MTKPIVKNALGNSAVLELEEVQRYCIVEHEQKNDLVKYLETVFSDNLEMSRALHWAHECNARITHLAYEGNNYHFLLVFVSEGRKDFFFDEFNRKVEGR